MSKKKITQNTLSWFLRAQRGYSVVYHFKCVYQSTLRTVLIALASCSNMYDKICSILLLIQLWGYCILLDLLKNISVFYWQWHLWHQLFSQGCFLDKNKVFLEFHEQRLAFWDSDNLWAVASRVECATVFKKWPWCSDMASVWGIWGK